MRSHLTRRWRPARWPGGRLFLAAARLLAAAILASASPVRAAQEPALEQPPSFDHLRPTDDLARDLLRDAWLDSAYVRALADTLETSDVFVQIEVRSQEAFRGRLRFMAGSAESRWLRVTLRVPGRRPDLMATLAHELQHAVEIAGDPHARDVVAVDALFHRIGFRRDEPHFETRAALEVERRVKREVGRAQAPSPHGAGTGSLSRSSLLTRTRFPRRLGMFQRPLPHRRVQ